MTRDKVPIRGKAEEQEHLAGRLREVRDYLGLSQDFVAQRTGIPRAAISAIENGKRKVEALELQALATLYKHPVSYFLSDSPEVPETVRAIAREASALTDRDRQEVLRFAQFLKGYGQAAVAASAAQVGQVDSGPERGGG
jgi:transcriptional regulator with XRE-family HTH domain